jgi:hypothetical protein
LRTTLERDEQRTRKLFLAVFYFCMFVMASITLYALYISLSEYLRTGNVIVGQVLVDTEFPFHGVAKLVTYLMIVTVVGWYCVVRLGGEQAKQIPKWIRSILQLVVLAIAIVSLYEFVYNFIIWNSLITADVLRGVLQFDKEAVKYPDPQTPWNLVFATKMSLSAFLISAHGFYTMSKQNRRDELLQ